MFEAPIPQLDCNGRLLRLDAPRIMGIVNVTPDSFSDGGAYDPVAHALQLVEEGADLLDVGGESTRPGASPLSIEEELRRVIPVIEQIVAKTSVPVSVDTSRADVMRAAVAAGAGMINDVRALREDGAMSVAAALGVPVVLMHMQGEPSTMQDAPSYADVVGEVHRFLADRILSCEFAGIDRRKIVVDPGFGFGKTFEHNVALLRGFRKFTELGVFVLAGLSRKGMIGTMTGRAVNQRAVGSAAAAMIAVQRGAQVVRVHDVAATRDALAVWAAVGSEAAAKASPKAKVSLFDDE